MHSIDLPEQAESLIDALLPYCRLIENLWPCAQGQQRSACPLDLNGSETRFQPRPCYPDFRRILDQFDIRFPASRSFISCLIACEAVQIRASPAFLLSEGHSAFPD